MEPFVIGHGLPTRVNPLAFGPLGHGWDRLDAAEARRREALLFARWLVLLRGLVGSQAVPFGPVEETAVGEALRLLTGYRSGATRLTEPTIPQLWRALDEPPDELVAGCRYADRRHFLDATRALRDALGALVKGSLAGLFDDHTTIAVDWRAPIQSLSLSRLEPLGDQAVGIALTCLNSWGQAMREIAEPGDLRIVIRDETWRQMRLGAEAMKSLDANLRLSRRDADVQILLAHKPSDMLTAGDADLAGGGHRPGPAAPVRRQGAARPGPGRRRRARQPARPDPDRPARGHRLGDRRQGPGTVAGRRTGRSRCRPSSPSPSCG